MADLRFASRAAIRRDPQPDGWLWEVAFSDCHDLFYAGTWERALEMCNEHLRERAARRAPRPRP